MSQVLYRKWRPQRLDQVVGQGTVTQTLRNAVAQGRQAHAYLFCGPRGTGKTSTARILAKAVNCLAPQDGEPDNECQMCVAINGARALDLIEIDAASNRGIDDIRNLRDKIHYSPNEARYKVYIVDEVHMLTEQAFNALLKTLEEPPEHAIFVLATTEAHKVPLTIISRCQRFDFRRIPLDATVGRLADVCKEEGIEASPDSLRLIARSAGGSLRDAENLLEQAMISYGSPLGEEQVRDMLELDSDERALELAAHAVNGDVREGLKVINEVAGQGSDIRQLHRGVVEYLRALLLVKSGAGASAGYSSEIEEQLRLLAEKVSLGRTVRALKSFAETDLRRDSASPLPLEMALVQSSMEPESPVELRPHEATSVAAVGRSRPEAPQRSQQRIGERTQAGDRAIPERAKDSEHVPAGTPASHRSQQEESMSQDAQPDAPVEPASEPVDLASEPALRLDGQWDSILKALSRYKGKRFNLGALLRDCKQREVADGTITLKFSYRSHMERMQGELEDPESRKVLRETLAKAMGGTYDVRVSVIGGASNGPTGTASQKSHLVRTAQAMGARVVDEREEDHEQEHATPGAEAAEADGGGPARA